MFSSSWFIAYNHLCENSSAVLLSLICIHTIFNLLFICISCIANIFKCKTHVLLAIVCLGSHAIIDQDRETRAKPNHH
jgi:hypothetical protein